MSNSFSWLIGMGVFSIKAEFIGKIIAVKPDDPKKPSLLIQLGKDSAVEITWDSVQGGKDILILKPDFDANKAKQVSLPLTDDAKKGWIVGNIPKTKQKKPDESRVCPTCGNKAIWVGEYGRWYCKTERKYL